MQQFLVAWVEWYYGNGKYPNEQQDALTWEEKMEAIKKTKQIKAIMG